MKSLKQMVAKYGQEETAARCNRGQSGICQAANSDRLIFAQEHGECIVLFEVRRIDKTGLEVASPKLSLSKKVTK